MFQISLDEWRDCTFVELAQHIIGLFVDDIETDTLNRLVAAAYATFDHPDVVGWKELDNLTVVELFHGPTLAFKDVALQLLGRLFQHVLALRNQRLNILGATSGDTGGAAIAGVRGQENRRHLYSLSKRPSEPATRTADDNCAGPQCALHSGRWHLR